MRADKVRGDDEKEAVERNAAGEDAPGGSGVVRREREEDRTATDRIDDGEEGADDEEDTFGDFEHGKTPRGEYSRGCSKDGMVARRLRIGAERGHLALGRGYPPPPFSVSIHSRRLKRGVPPDTRA